MNTRRIANHLPPLSDVVIPDFTTGDYNSDLEQRELDVIRGYNGYGGRDLFGLPLHEFRVLMDPSDPTNQTLQLTIDPATRIGATQWQRVLSSQRPQQFGDPNYVGNVTGQPPLNGGNACR